jgi:hypothetical protein
VSDPFNPDTDGDGLSDFVEFDLSGGESAVPVPSNPRSADTDGDGLTDRQELVGIVVRELGIITLNPVDADVDNDMRSDGDEAEFVDLELKRWIVVTEGKAPYRVFSDPRFADADFDGLVDGQEFGGQYRTDPNNSDTDGDQRGDGAEVSSGDNPLVAALEEAIRVTVVAQYIIFTEDGDSDAWSEVTTKLQVRLPDATGIAGLSNNVVDVLNAYHDKIDDRGPWVDFDLNGTLDGANPSNGDWYYFSRDGYNLPLSQRSYSFTLAKGQRFAVEGLVREDDTEEGAIGFYEQFQFGGLDGIPAFKTPLELDAYPEMPKSPEDAVRTVFSYDDIASKPIQQYYFQFNSSGFPMTQVGNADWGFVGELSFVIIVE